MENYHEQVQKLLQQEGRETRTGTTAEGDAFVPWIPWQHLQRLLVTNQVQQQQLILLLNQLQQPQQRTRTTAVEQDELSDRSKREYDGETSSLSTKNRNQSQGISKKKGSVDKVDDICCSICMDPWSSEGDHQVSCLPCGHVYGLSCIKKWIQGSKHSKCPQCNKNCSLGDVITLYVSRRLAVVDGELTKKNLDLQAENEFLKMKFKGGWEEINRIMLEMDRDHGKENTGQAKLINDIRKLIMMNLDDKNTKQEE